jgi:hypothetical protein
LFNGLLVYSFIGVFVYWFNRLLVIEFNLKIYLIVY